ncbi:phage holin family protein [Microcoleus sp. FACHB-1515]|uniref:phage holin family protein n=1 Tax=Cyanophyceae TaxID=3028117 RepID=UPI0016897E28|nr:phage holin family protein [Microcoleus sp. FACHB-1515]MBD2089194.1 phage holin family protein [Microcoleus sp. FACHB-1515]
MIVSFIILALVTAVSLLILSYIPFLGIEIDSPVKALISGVVFGLLNAFVRPVIAFFSIPLTFITFGLFTWVINIIIFGLAAWLVQGFRLRNGIVSAILGAIALALVNSLLLQIV